MIAVAVGHIIDRILSPDFVVSAYLSYLEHKTLGIPVAVDLEDVELNLKFDTHARLVTIKGITPWLITVTSRVSLSEYSRPPIRYGPPNYTSNVRINSQHYSALTHILPGGKGFKVQ